MQKKSILYYAEQWILVRNIRDIIQLNMYLTEHILLMHVFHCFSMSRTELVVKAYDSLVSVYKQGFLEYARWDKEAELLLRVNQAMPITIHHLLTSSGTIDFDATRTSLLGAVVLLHSRYMDHHSRQTPRFTLRDCVSHLKPYEHQPAEHLGRYTWVQRFDDVPTKLVMGRRLIDLRALYLHPLLVLPSFVDLTKLSNYLRVLSDASDIIKSDSGKRTKQIRDIDELVERIIGAIK